ncbi:MAG: penicillin-binding protein 2 [Planctomycetota bacterium]|jgi:cell division protein FtsI (penicillin-binding protein 3)|nr:penicillin-binding protein 2 [Planctomycetota bacterium]
MLAEGGRTGKAAAGEAGIRGASLFGVLISLVFLAVAARFFQLQVLEHDKFAEETLRQVFGVQREPERRGSIVDARGRVLASSVAIRACALDPKILLETEGADPARLFAELGETLNLSTAERENLLRGLDKRRRVAGKDGIVEEPVRFVWVKRRLSEEEWGKLSAAVDAARAEASRAWRNLRLWSRKLGEFKVADNREGQQLAREAIAGWRKTALRAQGRFAGVLFPPAYRRVYPQGEAAAHVLGFVDLDGRGLEGVEKLCQAFLEGRPLERIVARDARSRVISSLAEDSRIPDGLTVELTIDSAVQAMVEEELRLGMEKLKRESPEATGHAVVMDPFTGGILALANHPTFDPNSPGDFPARNRRNDAVATVQEPGSTFKPLLLSASIEEKLADFGEEMDCSTFRMDNGRVIKDIHPYGRMPLLMALTKSSNPAMVRVAQRLGPDRMREYVLKYGFGEKTGSLLPGEVGGRVTAAGKWSSYTMGSVPMGYEINVTTLQMAAAYSVIANGGTLPRPYLVAAVRDASGRTSLRRDPEMRRRVISPETAALMRMALRKVITDGTGRRANLAEYELGGKTGTAEMVANAAERAAGVGPYSKTRHTANFVALAPWDKPLAVICVSIRDTKKYGGEASSPVGGAIARRILAYFGLPAGTGVPVGALAGSPAGIEPDSPSPVYTVGAPDDDNRLADEIDPRLWEEWVEDDGALG